MVEKIDISGKEAESMVDSFKDLLQRLEIEKSVIEDKIEQTKNHLAKLGHKPASSNRDGKPRRKWGLNKQQIQEFLNAHPTEKFKCDDIATQLDIARSSTLATLTRFEKAGFVEIVDGLWKKKVNS